MDLIQHHVQAGRADLAGEEAVRLVRENAVHSLVPFLSGLLSLRGQPFTLDNHYQFEPLFSAYLVNSTVFKTGRQIGKCRPLRSTDTVSALNGRPLSPDELVVGTEILSVDENLRVVPARVTRVSRFEREPVFTVKTRCGSEVSFNGPHPLRTYSGFTPVEKLKPGDRVASISVGGSFGSADICAERIVLTAYLIGDGCCRRENVSFTSACEESLTEYSEALRRMAPSLPVRRQKSKSTASDIFTRREHPIVDHLIEDGLIGKYAHEKRVPAWVFDLDREKSALFLSRLWATDGTVKRRGASIDISYCTTSKGLSRDVRALLTKFGIRSSVTKRNAFAKAPDGTRKQGRDAYVIRVETRPSWKRFHDEIRVPGKPPFDLPTTTENSNRDSIPDDSFADIAEMAKPTKWKRAGVSSLLSSGLRVTPKHALSRAKATKYLEHFDDLRGSDPHRRFDNAVNGDVYWDEVTSVDREDDDVVWDIEVEGTRTYVIDGLVSHNTISMIGSSAVRCGLIPDYRIMYVTPLFSQVQRLSNEVARPILRESPIGHLMSGTRAEESVLRRTFFNRSRMEFTFASLTADRTRGATNDELDIDESYRGDNTYVTTRTGSRLLKNVPAGEEVLSFDLIGNLVWRRILTNSYHGRRRCYRLTTASGKTIDATSDSYVARPSGWVRVSSLIEQLDQWRRVQDEKKGGEGEGEVGDAVHSRTGADAFGHDAGGRVHREGRLLSGEPQPEAGRISLDQVHRLTRVRSRESFDLAEEQTRLRVSEVLHCAGAGVSLIALPVLPGRQEGGDAGVAGPDRPGGFSTVDRLVDRRRRVETGSRPVAEHHGQHPRLLGARGRAAGQLDDRSRLSVPGLLPVSEPEKADDFVPRRCQSKTDGRPGAAHAAVHEVQTGYRTGPGEGREATALPERLPAGEQRENAGLRAEVLLQEKGGRLAADALVLIEDVGEHDVYDIEVEDTHCFVANGLGVSNCQDLRSEHLPVMLETLSASKYGIVRKFGTPKTPENIIEGEWRKSSQGVWCIPCPYCKKHNFACLSHDLERMIGPYHPDISENRPGTVCAAAGCARPISPRDGFWVHRYPQRRGTAAGYHVPQPIMSLHYSSPDKWARLLQKRDSTGLYTPARYQNEVLGESAGEGLQLVTRDELQRASDETRPNYPHDPRRVLKNLDYHRYKLIFLSVDWGGGGESGLSLTVPVVLGMRHDGRIEVIYACRLRTPNDHLKEAQEVLEIFRLFRCQRLVHDYTGAGALRETVMVASGVDRRVLVPIQYVGGGATNLMTRVAGTQRSIRTYYRLNKSRSLLYTISAIRTRLVRFFAYDYVDAENPGLIEDFLALYEERIEHKSGSNIYVIDRNQSMTDDFAQALNIGCAAMWFMTKSWPAFDVVPDEYKKYILTAQQEAALEPAHPWADAIATEGLEGFDDA